MKKSYDEQIEEIKRDNSLSRFEKIEKIRKITQRQIKKYEREYFWLTLKNISGGVIIIGSSLIPVTHLVKVLSMLKIYKACKIVF